MADDDYIGFLFVDKRLSEYERFFDHDWCKAIYAHTKGTKLASPVDRLTIIWRGASNGMRMPNLTMLMIESYHNGFCQTELTPATAFILERLPTKLGQEATLRHTAQKKVAEVCRELLAQWQQERANTEFMREELWRKLLGNHEMLSFISHTMLMSYSALYYGYENFFRECMAIAKGDPLYKLGGKSRKEVDGAFGPDTMKAIFDDPEVQIGWATRNAISHAGAKETPDMKKLKHGIFVAQDGTISVVPRDIRRLHDVLKTKVMTFVEKHKADPIFV